VISLFTWKAVLELGEYAGIFIPALVGWKLGADVYMRELGIKVICEKEGNEAHGWR